MVPSSLAGYGGGISTYNTVSVELTGHHSQSDNVKLEPNPAYVEALKPAATDELQYEELKEGVTSSDVTMIENPAYQSVDPDTDYTTKYI